MGLGAAVREAWDRLVRVEAEGERKTVSTPGLPGVLAPFRGTGVANALPKPTAANLRRFAETPAARRAINCIKNRIASMEWRIEARPVAGEEGVDDRAERAEALTRALGCPNGTDSFQVLMEQVSEDVLVGGFGAIEMEATGDARVRGVVGGAVGTETVPLRDDELMYVRLNPRTHTVFGLGKVEVAFESISQFLQAHRYAAKMASHGVVQYALWMNERTPEQHERLIRWWQDLAPLGYWTTREHAHLVNLENIDRITWVWR